jgi:hypothetical protein
MKKTNSPFINKKVDSTYVKMAPPVQGRIAKLNRWNEAWEEARQLAAERRKKPKKPR